tara:strand:+ start:684 stop:911 length:228 start_codon:yes stop_codon:yes gene_type:complete
MCIEIARYLQREHHNDDVTTDVKALTTMSAMLHNALNELEEKDEYSYNEIHILQIGINYCNNKVKHMVNSKRASK